MNNIDVDILVKDLIETISESKDKIVEKLNSSDAPDEMIKKGIDLLCTQAVITGVSIIENGEAWAEAKPRKMNIRVPEKVYEVVYKMHDEVSKIMDIDLSFDDYMSIILEGLIIKGVDDTLTGVVNKIRGVKNEKQN